MCKRTTYICAFTICFISFTHYCSVIWRSLWINIFYWGWYNFFLFWNNRFFRLWFKYCFSQYQWLLNRCLFFNNSELLVIPFPLFLLAWFFTWRIRLWFNYRLLFNNYRNLNFDFFLFTFNFLLSKPLCFLFILLLIFVIIFWIVIIIFFITVHSTCVFNSHILFLLH